jgi:hypothetical protein
VAAGRAWLLPALVAAGLAIRLLALALAPRWGYLFDHDDLVRWGIQATDQGIGRLYDSPAPRHPLQQWQDGRWHLGERQMDRVCNYPPLCVYLLAISGAAHKALDPDRRINTLASRVAFSGWSVLCDLLLAWGCAALLAEVVAPGRRRLAFGLAWLAPPVWLISCFWGQVDTWALAPAVWMVREMLRGRWVRAGLLLGVVAAIKPQAVAFLPLWGMALCAGRPRARPAAGLLAAGGTLLGLAAPFIVVGGWSWWRQCYGANLFEHSRGYTTLMAFNPWYLDCLITDSLDEAASLMGLTRRTWGLMALAAALAAGFAWTLVRWRGRPCGYLLWCVLSLLALVMLPTRVHERFLLLVIPFLIVAALAWRRFAPGLVLLAVVATGQATWPQWLALGPPDWEETRAQARSDYDAILAGSPDAAKAAPPFEEFLRPHRERHEAARRRMIEWLLTLAALAGSFGVVVAALRQRPEPPAARAH